MPAQNRCWKRIWTAYMAVLGALGRTKAGRRTMGKVGVAAQVLSEQQCRATKRSDY